MRRKGSEGGRKAVAHEGAVQAGLDDVVLADGGRWRRYRRRVHHGRDGEGTMVTQAVTSMPESKLPESRPKTVLPCEQGCRSMPLH